MHAPRRFGRHPFRHFVQSMSRAAYLVLRCGLPLISAELIALALHMQQVRDTAPVTMLRTYPALFEMVLVSLLFLLIGAFLLDWIAKHP